MPDPYLSLAELKAALGDSGNTTDDAQYQRALDAASRQIDLWTGRHFWATAVAEPRIYRTLSPLQVWIGDFPSTAGVQVETDDDGDGVFETVWAPDEWQAEPLVRFNGYPYTEITAVGDRAFPVDGLRARIKVTAIWGWAEVPAPVRQACQMLAVAFYKSKDWTGGDIGFAQPSNVATGDIISLARALVESYRVALVPAPTLTPPAVTT